MLCAFVNKQGTLVFCLCEVGFVARAGGFVLGCADRGRRSAVSLAVVGVLFLRDVILRAWYRGRRGRRGRRQVQI